MRNFYFLLLLLTFPLISLGNDQQEKLFALGNQYYAKAKFNEAVKSYTQLMEEGYQSSALYYNLGNAYYKLDEIPSAILFYERAYKLNPGDEDIAVNLKFANMKIADKIEAVPEFFLAKWWKGFILFFPLKVLSVFAVVSLLAGFILLIVYLLSTVFMVKKVSFYSGIVFLVLGFVVMGLLQAQQNYFGESRQAIVFSGTVSVKSGPEKSLKTLFVVHEGLKVDIQQKENDWVKIVLPNGAIGWLELSAIRLI